MYTAATFKYEDLSRPEPRYGIANGLRAALLSSGTRLDAGVAGAATIRILEDTTAERVLTVSASNIPTAFELSYRVRVAVESQGRELMAPEEHTLTREYSFDERTLLAKEREREVLLQALADDLVALLMRPIGQRSITQVME